MEKTRCAVIGSFQQLGAPNTMDCPPLSSVVFKLKKAVRP